jgi:hypothetical protein
MMSKRLLFQIVDKGVVTEEQLLTLEAIEVKVVNSLEIGRFASSGSKIFSSNYRNNKYSDEGGMDVQIELEFSGIFGYNRKKFLQNP